MSEHYTQEQIEEIRLAFQGRHGPGIINEIVRSEYEKERINDLDAEIITKFYSSLSCGGIAKFIETINTPKEGGLFECGSHCIDFYGVMKGEFSFENAFSLVGIMIGDRNKQITPLEWLAYLSRGFDRLSKIQQRGFNDVCNDFANLNVAIAFGKGRPLTTKELFNL